MLARFFLNLNIFIISVFLSLFFLFSVQGEVNNTSDVDGVLGEPKLDVSSAAPEPASSTPEPASSTPEPSLSSPKSTGSTDFDCSTQYGGNKEYLRICNMYDHDKVRVIKGESVWSDLKSGLERFDDYLFVVDGGSIEIDRNFLMINKQALLPLSGEGFIELVPAADFYFFTSHPRFLSVVEVEGYARIGGLKINAQQFSTHLPQTKTKLITSVLYISSTLYTDLTMLDLSGGTGFDSVVLAITGDMEYTDPSGFRVFQNSEMDLKHSFLQSSGSENVIYIESLSADPGVFISNVVIKLNTSENIVEQNGIVFLGGNVWATSLTFVSDGETEKSGVKRYFLTKGGMFYLSDRTKGMKDDFYLTIRVDNSVFIVENKYHNHPTIIYCDYNKDGVSDRLHMEFIGNLYLGGKEDTPWIRGKVSIGFSEVWSENIMRKWTGKNGGITADAFFKEKMGYAGNARISTSEYGGPANYSSVASWLSMAMTSRKSWLPVDENNHTIEFIRCDQPECPSTNVYPSGTVAGLSLWGAVSTIGAAALGYITYQLTHGRSVGPFKPLQAVSTSPGD